MGDRPSLNADELRRRTDPESLSFESTETLGEPEEMLGQARAVEALRVGLGLHKRGYHVFAMGPTGTGRRTAVQRNLDERARDEPTPSDWCYVHNFVDPRRPRAIRLPAGQARQLAETMSRLIEELREALGDAFESERYRKQRAALEKAFERRREAAFGELRKLAEDRDVGVAQTPMGFALLPIEDGEVLPPQEIEKRPEEERAAITERLSTVQTHLESFLHENRRWQRDHQRSVRALDEQTTRETVTHRLDETRERYGEVEALVAYLDALQADLIQHAKELASSSESARPAPPFEEPSTGRIRFAVNVLIEHQPQSGAPVVLEERPTVAALLGHIEHYSHLGTLTTDFTKIEAGALHRANGGYLLLDARKLLLQPMAWEELKGCLRSGKLAIRSLAELLGLGGTTTLEPEPIPLAVKVVLVGERRLYSLLCRLDPEFSEHFKIVADFDDEMPRDESHEQGYARMIGHLCRKEGLLHVDAAGVARALDEAARWASHASKVSTNIRRIEELLIEADDRARGRGATRIGAVDLQEALDARERRSERLRLRTLEAIDEGTLAVHTRGERVGEVNALSVIGFGDSLLGRPSRITAAIRLGAGEVIDIEREVELGGAIHSKGVLILAGLLGARYLPERPLSLHASLVFEQSYGEVDGDSASMAELCALLSAIAEVPLRQGVAITGSVDQHGRAQAIGAVNEKIEGFYDTCTSQGLEGLQGVIIPAANVRHLMLRDTIVEAAREGRFHIWSVTDIDEALSLLTGQEAGQRGPDGRFPAESVNGRVQARLEALADAADRAKRP
ncbi:MAG: AAA family ATPase [Myxococcales bacterium]|nr:AAA family ATPase [Myxococcales bacterium]